MSNNGKEIDWQTYKSNTLIFSDSFKRTKLFKRSKALRFCGTHLTFGETFSERLKLIQADFCKDRLCPMCTWRRSLKLFGQTSKLMNYMESKEKLRYVFLTLTIKNVSGDELSGSIDALIHGFRNLMRWKEVKQVVRGACRQIEVTFNSNPGSKSFKTFHPHLHIIFAVSPNYFDGKRYIKQERWREIWAQCMNLDYDPRIYIETVNKSEQEKAIAELSKYPVKIDNLLRVHNLDILDYGLFNMAQGMVYKRLIEYYGVFRKYRSQLKLDDLESGDLVSNDITDDNDELTGVIYKYQWRLGCYVSVDDFGVVEF